MSLTEKLTLSNSSDGGSSLSGNITEVGSSRVEIDTRFGANTNNAYNAFSVTQANIQSVFLYADQPVTVRTNGTNEVQQLSITGNPTGGSTAATFGGQTAT